MSDITTVDQFAFIKGRLILESVVTAYETIHTVVHDKSQGLALKVVL